MTGSELLDARRNIRKELVAFISIVMIGLLAALAYLGIAYSAAALKQDALIFFNDRELWDVEVTSTMLMTDEDLEEIRALPGVREDVPSGPAGRAHAGEHKGMRGGAEPGRGLRTLRRSADQRSL